MIEEVKILREALSYAKFKLNEIELKCKDCADLAWNTTEELEKFVHRADLVAQSEPMNFCSDNNLDHEFSDDAKVL